MPSLNMSKASINCRCGKVYAPTRDDAVKIHNGVLRRRKRRGEHVDANPVRFYLCRFNSWHWTSQVVNTATGARFCATEWCNEPVPANMGKYHSVECRESWYAHKSGKK